MVLLGCGDLAEIARLAAGDVGVEVVAVLDPEAAGQTCGGRPVVARVRNFDALMVTDTRQPLESVHFGRGLVTAAGLPSQRPLVPRLLGISAGNATGGR